MSNAFSASLLYKRLDEAKRALSSIPASNGQKMVYSALVAAGERIERLEDRLASTETMRDRIAMQLLPSALACHTEQGDRSDTGSIRRAYELADEVMAIRLQGSAGALGETTSPEFSICKYGPGDSLSIMGEQASVTTIFVPADAPRTKIYEVTFASGRTAEFTGAEIAAMQAGYPSA